MSKRCQKENATAAEAESAVNATKNDERKLMLSSVIGSANAVRWKRLKASFRCKSEEDFVKVLLDIAEKQLKRDKFDCKDVETTNKENGVDTDIPQNPAPASSKKKDHKHKRKKSLRLREKHSTGVTRSDIKPQETVTKIPSVTTFNGQHKRKEEESLSADCPPQQPPKNSVVVNILHEAIVPLQVKLKVPPPRKDDPENLQSKKVKAEPSNEKSKKLKTNEPDDRRTKKCEYDVRRAPELTLQKDGAPKPDESVQDVDYVDEYCAPVKIKLCSNCDTRHLQDECPLLKPTREIADTVTYKEWCKTYSGESLEYEKDTAEVKLESENAPSDSYSRESLPKILHLEDTNTTHGLGVFTNTDIEEFTRFGPLVGRVVKEVDIPEDCSMKDVFEIATENTHLYFSTESDTDSNWLKYVRPAPTREQKNLLVFSRNDSLYFNTVRKVRCGEELLYWQDDSLSCNKKKMEKTICGGCNMTFLHPLYYRIHCSVFHDVRYSLTIRKYHCKVCGEAVLGKENIMKHAIELHNGQGAYQCQFCKKFFLRLNYLEMHRTYGCSSNPHRSRPLCDFCGRKFCQPQKLKVHIKRMHSDMSEVLKEFQCKNCFKILGSRAALQRHLKEVHQKQVDGACTCSKCGKLFQNKSNLKIHMLTHSGIKPFKCAESSCVAAFTTKQCLQFHYKKVHGFTEEVMPKIERSVDYTFEAYSGADDQDNGFEAQNNGSGSNINCSDQEDDSTDEKNIDDPPALHSPVSIRCNDQSSNSTTSPPLLEAYTPNMKILSKGSKKWIGDQTPLKLEISSTEIQKSETTVELEENEVYETPKLNLNTFSRHESSNASLLVEAALDSVCSDPNIDIDVGTAPNCTDTLVNNLYNLSHSDSLADVTYNHSVDVNDSRDINLISPSDQISVTDEINDELRQSQNIGLDYSSFHQEDFSPPSSPSRNNFVRDYINSNSPQNGHNYDVQTKNMSPTSPPRYDFGPSVNAESDDSNGIGAQNLSLHNPKESLQLDLSIYKSHYSFDNINFMRKDIRPKFDEQERKQVYILDSQKSYGDVGMNSNLDNQENLDMIDKDFDNVQDSKHKEGNDLDLSMRSSVSDIRNKFELDLDLRKSYDIDAEMRRTTYDSSLDDFRMKSYELDNLEIRNTLERNKTYENLIEEFRADRNFEPLVLNPAELQGLDMSARSYHNYPNLNRYHHIYSEVDRPSVDLRLNYTPPPPTYSHTDILRVVSLDLTPPGRHSVDLSLRSHQISNSRLLSEHTLQSTPHRLTLDQSRLLSSELTATRHLGPETRLISDMSNRILSDHTTNRILSNDQLPSNRLLAGDQRMLSDETRLISEQPRLLDQSRLLSDGRILPPATANGSISPVPYSGYSVSPSPYHPTALAPRPHATSPNPPSYHHYSAYY